MNRQTRFTRWKPSSVYYPSYRFSRTLEASKFDVPTIDENNRFWYFTHRQVEDKKYIQEDFNVDNINSSRPVVKHMPKVVSREPSFTNFKVPFQEICKERYTNSIKNYDKQFVSEINKLIENQPTAREATYFVRVVSYTTLWPPYHNEKELNDTSRRFYSLTPKERDRFHLIMSRDYSETG